MKVEKLKLELCELIDQAYSTAIDESHDEIVYPFTIIIHPNGEVEHKVIHPRRQDVGVKNYK